MTLLSTDWFVAGGTTAVRLKAEGFLAGATVAANEAKTIQELTVGVNQARAAIEASHAQHFAGGDSLKPSLEMGGRFDGGAGKTGAGLGGRRPDLRRSGVGTYGRRNRSRPGGA